jgi:hypothetical protein
MMHCGLEVVYPTANWFVLEWAHFQILPFRTLKVLGQTKFLATGLGSCSTTDLVLTMTEYSLKAI